MRSIVFVIAASLCAALATGCGGETEPGGGSGATVIAKDGAEVSVPAGIAPAGVTIAVAKSTATTAAVPAWVGQTGDVYAFTPHGTTFSAPVTLKLPYTGAGDVVLRLDDENDTTWEIVEGATFANGVATVQVSKFSLYLVASHCQKVCDAAEAACASVAKVNTGTCVSACQKGNVAVSKACLALESKLFDCYVKATDAAQFDCNGNGLPVASTCAAESDDVEACLAGSTGGTADATSNDAATTDAATTDAATTDAASTDTATTDSATTDSATTDSATTDTTPAVACPCFDATTITKAIADAKGTAGGKPGVSKASGGDPTEYAFCFHQKGGTPADFGALDKVSWVVVTALDSAGSEAYNGWFVAGPVDGKASCMAGKGDSNASAGPTEQLSQSLTSDELAACIAILVQVRDANTWTCGEQH